MTRFFRAVLLIASVLGAGPALAQKSKVGDWTIEKRTPRGSLQIPPGVVSQIPPPREAGHDDC